MITRRSFLSASSAALLVPSVFAAPAKKVLHIIGYSHIDPAWLWPWRDGSNTVLNTMRSALDRIAETPGFRYCHSSTAHYRWVQQSAPAMFAEIKSRIREGRWEVVGGWPVEPDCNIPSTESFLRHALYGKAFCQTQLATNVTIGFNPDSFGHAAGLPTILRHAGYDAYVFMRPREGEGDFPRLFQWEGPDGARVLTLHIWNGYSKDADAIPEALKNVFAPGFDHGAFFLGVGDHGGAVTKAQIAKVLEMKRQYDADPSLPELRWSTVREFLTAAAASPAYAQLPVIRGGLQHHARGCYSANGDEKYQNRRTERALITSESIAALTTLPYPRQEFAEAWQQLLINQFHDILAGTTLYADYEQSRDDLGLANHIALAQKITHLEALAQKIDMSAIPEAAVLAYNPLPWPRRALLQYIPGNNLPEVITHFLAPDGSKIPAQQRPAASMTRSPPPYAALVDLPACGYRVYQVAHETPAPNATRPRPTSPPAWNVALTHFGIDSLRMPHGSNLLAAPLGLVVIEDTSDTWAHGIDSFRKELGRPEFLSAEVAEDGPLLRVTRQHLRWRGSRITVNITETFDSDRTLEFHFVIDWNEHQQMLMFEVPTTLIQDIHSLAKVAGAITDLASTGNEEPGQDWIAIQGRNAQDEGYTLALLNAQTYSYSCKEGLLRNVLIRSAPYARHEPNPVDDNGVYAWEDQGRQERRFWLFAAEGMDVLSDLDRLADELQTPVEYILASRHSGTEPLEKSFLEIEPTNVQVLAIKQAENGSGLILRIQERSGRATTATIAFTPLHLNQSISLRPWQIKTLRLNPTTHTLQEVNALEF